VDKLVDNIKTIYVNLYGKQLTKPNTTIVESHGFDGYFDQQLKELEGSAAKGAGEGEALEEGPEDLGDEPPPPPGLRYRARHVETMDEELSEATPVVTPVASRPSTPGGAGHLVTAKPGPAAKLSRRARKAQVTSSAPVSSGDEAMSRKSKAGKSVKKGRKWDADGLADEDDDIQLDYSIIHAPSDSESPAVARSTAVEGVDASTWGKQSKGKFILKDLGDEVHSILAEAEAQKVMKDEGKPSGLIGSGLSSISGLFRNVVGGKTLTKEDLEKAMKGMEDHLLKKNVAREAAVRLCEGVEKELVGAKTGNFESMTLDHSPR
jgi:hypothetical protein